MKKPTLMIVGLGEVGGRLLEYLARVPNLGWRIVAAGRNQDAGIRKTNAAIFAASYVGCFPDIGYRTIDLADIDRTAETIDREMPDIVVNTATLAAWWIRDLLPDMIRERLMSKGAGPGLWAAGHLALTHKLMTALERTGRSPLVINSAYPDVVNVALSRIGRAPTVGTGNIDLLVPAIQHWVASRLRVPMRQVVPYLVAHNFHSSNILLHGTTHDVPFYLKVLVNGSDVTSQFDRKDLIADIPRLSRIPVAAGAGTIAAGSLTKTVLALINDTGERTHAPGPMGLPGGYPVELSQSDVKIRLPDDIDLAQAIAINEAGQRAEGIARIEADGSIVLTDEARDVLSSVFDLEIERFRPDEAERVAHELGERLQALGRRFGLHLPVH
ncbi:MAG: hypothetical protein ACYC1L_12870 [Alphaproteobacteria bacterium]